MKNTRKPSMDTLGRVVLPKAIREEARIQPGVPLRIRCIQGKIEIEPEPVELKVVTRGKIQVAIAREQPVLEEETVEDTINSIRNSRG